MACKRICALRWGFGLVTAFHLLVNPAFAAEIAVGCGAADLIAAFESANDQVNFPGGDTLVLAPGCTYSLTARYVDEIGLPPVTTGITVEGNGAIIERAAGAVSFGVTRVSGDLLLSDLTLREFWGFAGAYFRVTGSLVLSEVVITNAPPIGQQDPAIEVSMTGTLAIIDSTIENQFDIDSGAGGAVDNDGFLAVSGSIFRNNHVGNISGGPAVQVGGAISNAGTAYISDSTFSGNIAGATGGAIANSGTMEVRDTTFSNGSANFGAAIYNSGGAADLLVEHSYFERNDADIGGGAIYNGTDALATVRNSSFYRNRALVTDGGAVLNRHAIRIEYSTFSENTAAGDGDTLASELGTIGVEAVVLSGAPGSSHCAGTMIDFGYIVVHPAVGTCPGTFMVGDPKLTVPAPRGGDTETMAIGAGSAAYNAASDTDCPATDQRGRARPVASFCDAGALEDQPPAVPGAPVLGASSSTPNQGLFALVWPPATDPDATAPTYRLYHRSASDAQYGFVANAVSSAHSFSSIPESEGTFRYRVLATDGNNLSALSAESAPVVVDQTGPGAPAATADRVPDYAGGPGWYADTVTVSFSGADDPLLQDGSAGSGVAQHTAPQAFTTSGEHTASGKATDYAGNDSPNTELTVHVDADEPVVAFPVCPADVLLHSNAQASWEASDAHSGLATAASGTEALDTSSIATRSVAASATDHVGHEGSAECVYRIVFEFSGFFKPLDNPPAQTAFRAGDVVPVTFALGGDQGMGIMAPGYPHSEAIACGTAPQLEAGSPTSAARELMYKRGNGGRYTYFWETEAGWAGTCRQLIIKLTDGTYHRVNVRLM